MIRWVDAKGHISLGGFSYRVGRVFSGEPVEVVCQQGLVEVVYKGTSSPPTPSAVVPTTTAAAPRRGR